MRIEYAPEAVPELQAIGDWLESAERGLGRRFFDRFDARVVQCAEFPNGAEIYYRDIRKVRITPFQVYVLYRVKPTSIQLVAVVDARQDPRTIRQLLHGR